MTDNHTNATANRWQGYCASSIGKAHVDSGLPNQDRANIWQDARVTVAVVCDGAGSATHSEQGADYFCQAVGQALFAIGQDLTDHHTTQARQMVNQTVLARLSQSRDQLVQQMTAGQSLRDFHTTLSAVLVVEDAALLVQIGDSPLMTSSFVMDDTTQTAQVDYFGDLQVFAGDDGEYVNETQFITQADWQSQLMLRWLDIGAVDLLALMSDGCADLVFTGASTQTQVYRPFFGNVVFNLCASISCADAEAMLCDVLASPATYRLTGDDKSLIVLLKQPERYRGIAPLADTPQKTPSMPTSPIALAASPTAATDLPTKNRTPVSALPANQMVTAATQQRRNVAVVASVAVLVGMGALLWSNYSRIQHSLTANAASTHVQPAPTPVLPTLSSPAQAFAPTAALAMWHAQQTQPQQELRQQGVIAAWALQFVIDDSAASALGESVPSASVPRASVAQPTVQQTAQAAHGVPAIMTGKILAFDTLRPSNDAIALTYGLTCREVTPAENQTLARVGVPLLDVTSRYQRRYCRLTLQPVQTVAAYNTRALVLAHGVGETLKHATKDSQVFYLPPSFDIDMTQTSVSASAVASQPVTQQPDHRANLSN